MKVIVDHVEAGGGITEITAVVDANQPLAAQLRFKVPVCAHCVFYYGLWPLQEYETIATLGLNAPRPGLSTITEAPHFTAKMPQKEKLGMTLYRWGDGSFGEHSLPPMGDAH